MNITVRLAHHLGQTPSGPVMCWALTGLADTPQLIGKVVTFGSDLEAKQTADTYIRDMSRLVLGQVVTSGPVWSRDGHTEDGHPAYVAMVGVEPVSAVSA